MYVFPVFSSMFKIYIVNTPGTEVQRFQAYDAVSIGPFFGYREVGSIKLLRNRGK